MVTLSAVQQLEESFNVKRMEIEGLQAKRAPIENEISAINAEISQILGDGRTIESILGIGKRSKRKRFANEKSLRAVVIEALKKPMRLAELAGAVIETGYRSNSGNFRNVLYQCLYNNSELFQYSAATGNYSLIKGKARN